MKAVSSDKYRRIFCSDFNIGFKLPKSDTCKLCDEHQIRLSELRSSEKEEEVKEVELLHKVHILKAEELRKTLSNVVEVANNTDTHVIAMDLQQALPTPLLSAGPAFYKRKIWTFNFGVHDCIEQSGFMFVWNEVIGKRGSDEIGSCILKYIKSRNIKNRNLVIFSDNCPGQNKNWTIAALWHHLVLTNAFDSVEHKFLLPGHSHLPCDRDFGRIEKFRRLHYQNVYSTEEWCEVIAKSNKKKPYVVTLLTQEDILPITNYITEIAKKTVCDGGKPLNFSQAVSMKFVASQPHKMFLKHAVHGEFIEVSLKKRGRISQVGHLNQKYRRALGLNPCKVKDAQELLKFIPPIYHSFYMQLNMSDKDNICQNTEENEDEIMDII